MQTIQRKFKNEKFSVIFISTDYSISIVNDLFSRQLKGQPPAFTVLLGNMNIKKMFKGRGEPLTYIIDEKGLIQYVHRGYSKDLEKYIEVQIRGLLEKV